MREFRRRLVLSLYAIAICAMGTLAATVLPAQVVSTVAPSSKDVHNAAEFSQVNSVRGRDATSIRLIQIDTVYSRARNRGKGFIVGAVIGGAVGAAGVALLAASITHGTHEHCNCGDTVLATIGVSALVGGLIGAAIGWPSERRSWLH
jgi:hypothetical protein